MRRGVHQFLSKPCETATLTSAVRKSGEVRDSFRDMATRMRLHARWMAAEPVVVYDELR